MNNVVVITSPVLISYIDSCTCTDNNRGKICLKKLLR